MPWPQLLVAFLAGYGLMSLAIWLVLRLDVIRRDLTISLIVLAADDGYRIEGVTRGLHALRETGRILEILVAAEGSDETGAIVDKLTRDLPGIELLPAGSGLSEAMAAARGQMLWVLELKRIKGCENQSLWIPFYGSGRTRRGDLWQKHIPPVGSPESTRQDFKAP